VSLIENCQICALAERGHSDNRIAFYIGFKGMNFQGAIRSRPGRGLNVGTVWTVILFCLLAFK
jgi:hypothetical protein